MEWVCHRLRSGTEDAQPISLPVFGKCIRLENCLYRYQFQMKEREGTTGQSMLLSLYIAAWSNGVLVRQVRLQTWFFWMESNPSWWNTCICSPYCALLYSELIFSIIAILDNIFGVSDHPYDICWIRYVSIVKRVHRTSILAFIDRRNILYV